MSENLLPFTTDQKPDSLDVIRSETALSRYPIHRLANKGLTNIEIRKKDEKGNTVFLWQVSHNSRYGQPGPLAYKLDTIVINRRIDESGKPAPKILKLGSLREIADELNLGGDTSILKKALRQNASAFITAKTAYKGADGIEHTFEFSDTRYGLVFTGEKLPNGVKADAVYLVFHDLYLAVLNTAPRRPLDYDYLCALPPAPQRFYEILSYQMLPAIRYNQRAKLPYSEFCMLSTMTRYETFEQVKKQMYKIHLPHIRAEYIGKVDYETTTDEEGRPDWNMFYVPGERAKFQQLVFSFAIDMPRRVRQKRTPPVPKPEKVSPPTSELPLVDNMPRASANALGLAKRFYRLRYGQEKQITPKEHDQADALLAEDPEWAAYLVERAARYGKEQQNGFPENFGGVVTLAPKFRADYDAESKKRRESQLKKARRSHEDAHTSAYRGFIGTLLRGRLESTLPEAFSAFRVDEERLHRFLKSRAGKSERGAKDFAEFDNEERRIERLLSFIEHNPKCGVPTFWQWDEKMNPERFREPV